MYINNLLILLLAFSTLITFKVKASSPERIFLQLGRGTHNNVGNDVR
jgi:hypothetical protein